MAVDPKLILYAKPFLKLYGIGNVKLEDMPKALGLSEKQVCDLLKYLKLKGYVRYDLEPYLLGNKKPGEELSDFSNLHLTNVGAEEAVSSNKTEQKASNPQPTSSSSIINNYGTIVNSPIQQETDRSSQSVSVVQNTNEIRNDSYYVGIVSGILSAFFAIAANNTGWLSNLSGQASILFLVVFGLLCIGCFVKPEIFGPITKKFLDSLGRRR